MRRDAILTEALASADSADEPRRRNTRRDFEVDMCILKLQLEGMAARCRDLLHRALDVYRSRSFERIAEVCEADEQIDQDEKNIDMLLLRILALRQPVASDLRRFTASIKIVTDLERIGDEAVNLAQVTRTAAVDPMEVPDTLWRLAEQTEEMVDRSARSFLSADAALAHEVLAIGTTGGVLHDRVLRDTVHAIGRRVEGAHALSWITAAGCLERTARHASNMALGTLFVLGVAEAPR